MRAEDRTPGFQIPDDLQNEDFVFEGEEMEKLTEVLDAYAALTAGADNATQPTYAGSPSGLTGTLGGMDDTRNLKRQAAGDPYILRPIFCRFLLGSKMCGDANSLHNYHEFLCEFDKYAVSVGPYSGMPRTVTILLLANMLRRKGDDGLEKCMEQLRPSSQQLVFDAAKGDFVEAEPRPAYIRHFIGASLLHAQEHALSRKLRFDRRDVGVSALVANEVPANVLAEVSSGSLWPPLPPRCVLEPQLPEWMQGVRKWQEELEQQNPAQMLAMRRYTETVLRGEVLVSQLLEPEVLHFAARFRPLFEQLFSAYADWPAPEKVLDAYEMEDITDGTIEMHKLGHLSCTAFFRLCADFGIFPHHCSFEEIRQIYHDAEAVIIVPQSPAPSTPSERVEDVHMHLHSSQSSPKEVTKDPKNHKESTGSSMKSGMSQSQGDSRPTSRARAATPQDGHGKKDKTDSGAKMMNSKKAQQAAAIAEAAAKAAAEAAVPKTNVQFMDKPFSVMTALELRTVCFFASIDQWLSERFTRFAELWWELEEVRRSDMSYAAPCSATWGPTPSQQFGAINEGLNSPADSSPKTPSTRRISGFDAQALPPEVLQLQQSLMETVAPMPPPNQRRNSTADKHAKATAAAVAVAQAAAAAAMAVPPVQTVSAKALLEVIAPMGMANRPSETEIDEMYALLLQDDLAKQTKKAPLGVSIFQMDKVLRAARKHFEQARRSCSPLLRTTSEQTADEKDVCAFFTQLNTALFQRAGFMGMSENFLAGCEEVKFQQLMEKIQALGVDIEKYQDDDSFRFKLMKCIAPGSVGSMISAKHIYRALSLTHSSQHTQRREELCKTLRCLAHLEQTGPRTKFFGVAAFTECLLKLALHRLGGNGSNEIQRGAPSWWKCAWLVALLSGQFTSHIRQANHEQEVQVFARVDDDLLQQESESTVANSVQRLAANQTFDRTTTLASPERRESGSATHHRNTSANLLVGLDEGLLDSEPVGFSLERHKRRHTEVDRRHSTCGKFDTTPIAPVTPPNIYKVEARRQSKTHRPSEEVDAWHRRSCQDMIPRYMSPMEQLVRDNPGLFDPATAEDRRSKVEESGGSWPVPCPQCCETLAPSGWGTPSCPTCSGVEEQCLPISNHTFCALFKTELPELTEVGSTKEDDADDGKDPDSSFGGD
jgi:hypothetical protein